MEIEATHPRRSDYLSKVSHHNYTDLLHAIHVTAYGSLQQHRLKGEEFHLGSSQEMKKVHLARWEIVTNTKENGSLGIRSMRNINIAFMAKPEWRLITETKDLWARVLQGKYVKGNVEIQKLMRKQIFFRMLVKAL